MEQITKIALFILNSLAHLWPYLLISIPLAVGVQFTGAAKYINRIFNKSPLVSILLATVVGAFSPFCSCGVIPVIASLLIGGVPLAPVMSFWIASPSMDPEIFFLSVATLGWKLSIWRLVSTFAISLSSGYITHLAIWKGFLNNEILRQQPTRSVKNPWNYLWNMLKESARLIKAYLKPSEKLQFQSISVDYSCYQTNSDYCSEALETISCRPKDSIKPDLNETRNAEACTSSWPIGDLKIIFYKKLAKETLKTSLMVIKFMSLVFFVHALIKFYVPRELIKNLIGGNSAYSVFIATLAGIPAYTSNITALPLIGGLLSAGMNPGAALAFLIAGPTTTLSAMLAVWGIVKRRIFILYLSFSITGAILGGLLFNLITA